jgi:hypothetical protein
MTIFAFIIFAIFAIGKFFRILSAHTAFPGNNKFHLAFLAIAIAS